MATQTMIYQQTRSRPMPIKNGSPGIGPVKSPATWHSSTKNVLGGCPPPAPKMGSMEVPSRLATTIPSLQLPAPVQSPQSSSFLSVSSSMERVSLSKSNRGGTNDNPKSVLSVLESMEFQRQFRLPSGSVSNHSNDIDAEDIVRYQQGRSGVSNLLFNQNRSSKFYNNGTIQRIPSLDEEVFTLDS
uniref:Uncharacterized protein n=1 Tax=Aureoumbra lagunensis TaxID=44058 RepID=A0A7S3JSQ4_9STRA|mmetsp:Transcript_15316/g.20289  ORF Transcript_15316/g.20289 Transcript_15316/m.20289 type:complete len:186 (+) Transcript_15316:86-643(+)